VARPRGWARTGIATNAAIATDAIRVFVFWELNRGFCIDPPLVFSDFFI
jgi:hypothetical protein